MRTACYRDACAHFLALIERWRPILIREVRDGNPALPVSQRIGEEGERVLALLRPDDRPILLAENGTAYDSLQFSAMLGKLDASGPKKIIFIIGGPFGHSPELCAACKASLSLSPMTFPHELARVMLLEQIFRAQAIISNFPYHH